MSDSKIINENDHDRLVRIEEVQAQMKHDVAGIRRSLDLWSERFKHYPLVQATVFGFVTLVLVGFVGAIVTFFVRS